MTKEGRDDGANGAAEEQRLIGDDNVRHIRGEEARVEPHNDPNEGRADAKNVRWVPVVAVDKHFGDRHHRAAAR